MKANRKEEEAIHAHSSERDDHLKKPINANKKISHMADHLTSQSV